MVVSAFLALSACRDREIVAYRAPKDPPPTLSAPAAATMNGELPEGHPPIGQSTNPGPMGNMAGAEAPAVAEGNALTWTAPADWQAKALGMVRKGSYTVPGEGSAAGDVAITAFPGDTGGLFANVNRWRGQVGLPPVAETGLASVVQNLDINGFHMSVVDLTGTINGQPTRLLGAIVPFEGQTWFFKLTGPEPTVAKQAAAFRDFLSTIKAH